MIQNGDLDPLEMVSHRVKLEELDKVYYKFEKKEDRMQKVFVQTRFSAPPAEGSPQLTVYGKQGVKGLVRVWSCAGFGKWSCDGYDYKLGRVS